VIDIENDLHLIVAGSETGKRLGVCDGIGIDFDRAAGRARSWTSRAATHVAAGWNSSIETSLAPLPLAMKTSRRPETGVLTAGPAAMRKKSWWEALWGS
jgi:hypothetical protein